MCVCESRVVTRSLCKRRSVPDSVRDCKKKSEFFCIVYALVPRSHDLLSYASTRGEKIAREEEILYLLTQYPGTLRARAYACGRDGRDDKKEGRSWRES